MARLPQPGGDQGTWGSVLNDYLSVAHNPDGSLKDLPFNVKDYGAKGDGITDDTVAIQNTINAANALSNVSKYKGAGQVYIPPGFYKVSDTILINNAATLMIRGAGSWTTQIVPTAGVAGKAVFKFQDCYYCGLSDLWVSGYTPAPPECGVESRVENAGSPGGTFSPTGLRLERLTIGTAGVLNMNYGIKWTCKDAQHDFNNDLGIIREIRMLYPTKAGVYIGHSNSVSHLFERCQFATPTAFELHGGSVIASSCQFSGATPKSGGGYWQPLGWIVDCEDGNYNYTSGTIRLMNCQAEGASSVFKTTANAFGVRMDVINSVFGSAPTGTDIINWSSQSIGTQSRLTITGGLLGGAPGTGIFFNDVKTRVLFEGVNLSAATIAWKGGLTLFNNWHEPGSVTLSPGPSATLTQIGDGGGAFGDAATGYMSGDMRMEVPGKGLILKSPNGTRYKIAVSDTGTVTSTKV